LSVRRAPLLAALLAVAACAPSMPPRHSTALPNVQVLAERLPMPGLQRERSIRLYLPPSYAKQPDRRYPVIYMHDAQNLFDDATSFVGEWGVDESLNELARTRGFEAIVVGIDHGGDKRTTELNPWPNERFGQGEGDAYLDFIVHTVKPWIDARWRTRPEAAHTAIVGSSLGALVSHYALLRHAATFGKAGVLSPAYWIAPQIVAATEQAALPGSARLYLYAGTQESDELIHEVEAMHALLDRKGVANALHVQPGGQHNEAAWRAEFALAVIWLFELP
jgi:predicted alpha/beta superfamily hydrolase